MQQGTIVEGMQMATYAEIQKFVQRHHGFIPKTGWIAHVKEVHGVPTLRGANRARRDRDIDPCPPEKRGTLPAIAVTAYYRRYPPAEVTGWAAYFRKPLDVDEFVRTIAAIFRRPGANR